MIAQKISVRTGKSFFLFLIRKKIPFILTFRITEVRKENVFLLKQTWSLLR